MANEQTEMQSEPWPDHGIVTDGVSENPSPIVSATAPPPKAVENWTLPEALDRLEVEAAKRRQAEETLRESEERFRQLTGHVGTFLWISDPETKELIYVSPGYEETWSRVREGTYSSAKDWVDSFAPKTHNRLGTAPKKGRGKNTDEYQVVGPDGSVRWIRDRMFPLRDESGQVLRILGIAEDITEAKELVETLARSELKNRALLNALPDLMFRVRKDGVILEFKASKDSHLPAAGADLVGKKIDELLPAQIAAQVSHYLDLTLSTSATQTFTCQYLLPDDLRDFEARSVYCGDGEVLAIVRDVTERKRLEKEILEISNREQQRIGQDLHDGLGQHLTGITFLSKALEKKLKGKSMAEATEAAEIGKLVIQALAQTRNLARGLFPVELENNGLVSALRELASSVERMFAIKCEFQCEGTIVVQDNVLATHLFRISQEAINNAFRHGQAKNVAVTLSTAGEKVVLQIKDDGTGYKQQPKHDGLGLKIMQYRARRIGGSFEIQAAPKGGTVVTCSFSQKQ